MFPSIRAAIRRHSPPVAVTVSRTLLRLIVNQDWARKARLYGVAEHEFVARPTGRAALRGEARGRV